MMQMAEHAQTYKFSVDEELAFCRNDLSAFIEKSFKIVSPGVHFENNWHLECIAEYLTACQNREIKKLIINIPPRYLKSISCTVAWPAWLLGKDPSTKIMCASYSGLLSTKHSVDCRYLIESQYYRKLFPRTIITDDNNQKTKYVTTQRGHRIATSVGGTSTGEGGNFLIIDDPHSAGDAQSKQIRTSQLEWFDQSWSTRLNDKKNDVMLVIMQRLHESDLTGHLLEKGGWEHLCLAAVAPENKTISIGNFYKEVNKGDILHPEREGKQDLKNLEAQMGSYAYAGQYLQRPAPEGGGLFKRQWVKLFPAESPLPKFEFIIQSYDTALTDTTSADYTAMTAWGIWDRGGEKGFGTMLIDAWHKRLAYPELRKKVRAEYETRYGDGEGKRPDIILIENKGSGISLIQDMQRAQLPIHSYNPGRADKTQRLSIVSYIFEAGLVYMPESDTFKGKFFDWCENVIKQLTTFPNDEHDDYVDSVTQAIRYFRDASFLKVKSDPVEDPTIETFHKIGNPYAQ